MTKLLDDEIQQDELFWSQDALKEEEDDENYEAEAEVADEFDSDFDDDVSQLPTYTHFQLNFNAIINDYDSLIINTRLIKIRIRVRD